MSIVGRQNDFSLRVSSASCLVANIIASGGMASLHLGTWRSAGGFRRLVAIKKLLPEHCTDPDYVAMLFDEATLASRVRHPCLVSVLDVLTDGEPLLVLEYIHGAPLSWLVRELSNRHEKIPLAVMCAIAEDVLRGLQALHDARTVEGEALSIVHRDVTPHNLLVGADGLTRLIDLGVAKAVQRGQNTRHGEIKGKPGYLAPEQVTGAAVDRRTDLFSLGLVILEMVHQKRLVHADDALMVADVITDWRNDPWGMQDCPEELVQVLRTALDPEPAGRFANASEMAEALLSAVKRASPSEVGEWVLRVAKPLLEERERLIRSLEQTGGALPGDTTVPLRADPDSSRETPRWATAMPAKQSHDSQRVAKPIQLVLTAFFGALVGVVALSAFQQGTIRRDNSTDSRGGTIPNTVVSSDGKSSPPLEFAQPTTAQSAISVRPINSVDLAMANLPKPIDIAHTTDPIPKVATSSSVEPKRKSKGTPATSNCAPPYVVDSEGVRTFKPECL